VSTLERFDVIVVGGGPAGHAAALRCAGNGLSTVLVEQGALGGTCLNVGCIPSKALIHAADTFHGIGGGSAAGRMGIEVAGARVDLSATMRWKDDLVARLRDGYDSVLARSGAQVRRGAAEVVDAGTVRLHGPEGEVTLSARSLVVATGSRPVELAHLPFGGAVMSSADALCLDDLPSCMVVVGGGYIGLELGTALAKLGTAVTVVEMAPRVLPLFEESLVRPVARRLAELGVDVLTDTTAAGLDDGHLVVQRGDGGGDRLPADAVLVTVGRRPVVEGFGLERLGLAMVDGHIAVDGQCQSSVRGVYAIGDVTGEPMLAHRGIAQGELVGDVLAGADLEWDHRAVPAVCFTDPEVLAVGLTADEAAATLGRDALAVGQAPFRANGRAGTMGDDDGLVRVVAERASGAVLGVQAVGPGVSELAATASLAIELATTLDDLAATITAHPTLAETFAEAVAAARRRRS
jgi:dihydrolipoamide dehydrogenase